MLRCAILLVFLDCSLLTSFCSAESSIAPVPDNAQKGQMIDLEKARRHFSQGVEFYNAGDYKLSLIEFRRSYELSKNYRILYNIGQVNQQLGNYTNALTALEEYVEQAGADIADDRKAEVTASVVSLKARVAHIRIATNVTAPEVLIDGFPEAAHNPNGDIALDPGDHRIDLRKAGYQNNGTVVTLAAGDLNRVRIALTRIPAFPPVSTPVNSQVAHRNSTLLWIGWTTTVATAVGAGVTGILALNEANDLANLRNSPGSTQAQRDEVGMRAKKFAYASDALAVAAIATGAASLYLTLRPENRESEHPRAPSTRLSLTMSGVRFEQSF